MPRSRKSNINEEAANKKYITDLKLAIKCKMQAFDDFGICNINDEEMKAKLMEVAKSKPDKDPREVLDYYCRPIIQAKVNSWI